MKKDASLIMMLVVILSVGIGIFDTQNENNNKPELNKYNNLVILIFCMFAVLYLLDDIIKLTQ